VVISSTDSAYYARLFWVQIVNQFVLHIDPLIEVNLHFVGYAG